MYQDNKQGKLGNLKKYLLQSYKFFELENKYLTPVIFVVMLLANFITSFMPEPLEVTDMKYVTSQLLSVAVVQLASSIYLIGFIKELKREEYSFTGCIRIVAYNMVKIISFLVIYYLGILLGTVFLIIPAIIIWVMFIFTPCYILDKNTGIIEAFKESKNLTDGKKMSIFLIAFLFSFTLILPTLIIITLATQTNNTTITYFILSFMGVILNLMNQRLVAMLYVDLEYGTEKKEVQDSNSSGL